VRRYLQGNNVPIIASDFCSGCGSVKWIEMQNCGIEEIGSGFCSSCKKMQMLCAARSHILRHCVTTCHVSHSLDLAARRKMSNNELGSLPENFLNGASRLTTLKLDGNMLDVRWDEEGWAHSFCSGCSRLNLMSMEQNKVAELPPGWIAGWSGTTREPRPFGLLRPPPADAIIFNDENRFNEEEMARVDMPPWDNLAWASWVRERG